MVELEAIPAVNASPQPLDWAAEFFIPPPGRLLAEATSYKLTQFCCPNLSSFEQRASDIFNHFEKSGFKVNCLPIRLFAFQDVLIGKFGTVFIDGKIVEESLRPLPKKYRDVLNQQTQQIYTAPLIDEETPLLMIEQPGSLNYGHWIVEMLPKIGSALEELKAGRVKLAMTEAHRRFRIIIETLALAGIEESAIRWLPDRPVRVRRLLFLSPITRHMHPGYISPWSHNILRSLTQDIKPHLAPEKLFISRQDARSRQLLNEDEVFSLLEPQGYVRISTGQLSFSEQVSIFKGAKEVVGVFGASMTSIVFCPPGTKVTIICPNNFLDHFYWNISSLSKLQYHHVNGSIIEKPDASNYTLHDFSVDPELVLNTLR